MDKNINPVRNSKVDKNMEQIPLEVSSQLLREQKANISNGVNRRNFLRLTCVTAAGAVLPGCADELLQSAGSSANKPNFIIIFCDDLDYGDLGDVGRKGKNQRPAGWVVTPKPLLFSSKPQDSY